MHWKGRPSAMLPSELLLLVIKRFKTKNILDRCKHLQMLEVNAKTKCLMSYKIKNTLRYTVTSCTFITPFHGHQWIQKLINLLLELSFVEDFNIIEKNGLQYYWEKYRWSFCQPISASPSQTAILKLKQETSRIFKKYFTLRSSGDERMPCCWYINSISYDFF